MKWEIVIGLETHAQLSTASKIFSGSSTAFGAAPNSQASAVDIALPGVLPVLNKGAVERAIRFGLAVGGNINRRSVFARKNYFYPDLPKGYQISQYELPIIAGGEIIFMVGDEQKKVRLTRAQLEEDAGKSLHEDFRGMSGIDLNRAGTPLLEIVSEPEMHSAEEAVAYAKTLHSLVRWIGICDGNMQEGSFRCDANVSVRPQGLHALGTRCEIKNLNSFRFLEQAIKFEVQRQIEILEDGGTIVQETRLYDPDKNETRSMRSKEDAMDYRYFPDPDLPPLEVSEQWVEEIRSAMSETQKARQDRFQSQYGLSKYDAVTLTFEKSKADYFEQVIKAGLHEPKIVANWVIGEVFAILNKYDRYFDDCPLTPQQLSRLLTRIEDGTISNKIAKEVFLLMCEETGMYHTATSNAQHEPRPGPGNGDNLADEIIDKKNLRQISDGSAIGKIVDQVIAANPKSVEEFKAGKEKAFNALVGQVMRAMQGKANPAQVNELLKKKLGG